MACEKCNAKNAERQRIARARKKGLRGTEKRVTEDIAERQFLGVAKYGTTVEANPLELKDWLQHAYEETLDQAIYLRRAIELLENSRVNQSEKMEP